MNAPIVYEQGSSRLVVLSSTYVVGYRWLTIEQIHAAFTPREVTLARTGNGTPVELQLSHQDMEALLTSYQTYRTAYPSLRTEEGTELLEEESELLDEQPF